MATIQENFERFHAENPHVYDALVNLAFRAKYKGYRRVGVKHLFEILRWESPIQTSGDEFRLNNNYFSRYARKLITDYPEQLGELIEVRELKAA